MRWGTGHEVAKDRREIIAYFMLVVVITELTIQGKCLFSRFGAITDLRITQRTSRAKAFCEIWSDC
jgi:hypothetical protein